MTTFIASGKSVRDGETTIRFYRIGNYSYSIWPSSRTDALSFESSYEDALEKFQKLVGEITFAEAI